MKRKKLEEKYHKCVLIRRHLRPNQSDVFSLQLIASSDTRERSQRPLSERERSQIDHNEQQPPPPRLSTRAEGMTTATGVDNNTKKGKIRTTKYIAWHHFDPRIIETYAVNRSQQYSFTSVKSVPSQFVKDVIKYSGYFDCDKNTTGNYHSVPSYLIQNSRADFADALKHKQAEGMVDSVMKSNTTRSLSTRRTL